MIISNGTDVFKHVDTQCDTFIAGQHKGCAPVASLDYLKRLTDMASDDGKLSSDEWLYLNRKINKAALAVCGGAE